MADWLGIGLTAASEAETVRIPEKIEGSLISALSRWTSEAARRLRLSRRGQISLGAPADLVIWSIPSDELPADAGALRVRQVVLDGALLDPSKAEAPARGKFLSR